MLMLRFLLKLSALFAALSVLAIGIIRAQPYDDGGLRDFLFNSPGCEDIPDDEPCFVGIRPGVTTMEETRTILSTYPLIRDLECSNRSRTVGHLSCTWFWIERLDSTLSPRVRNLVVIDDNVVSSLRIHTRTSLSAFWLILGTPDYTRLEGIVDESTIAFQFYATFLAYKLVMDVGDICPTSTLWGLPTTLTFGTQFSDFLTEEHESPNDLFC